MTAMAWRIVRTVLQPVAPMVVTTLAVTALTVSAAAALTALGSRRQVAVLHDDAQCRKAAARWLNSPQGQRWIAMKNNRPEDHDPSTPA